MYNTFDATTLKMLDNNIISDTIDHTHAGYIQYIFVAWAHGLGIVLKPEFIFYTIISEIKNFSLHNNKFHELFATKMEKNEIEMVNFTLDKLINTIYDQVSSKDLVDIVTNTTFDTNKNPISKPAPTHFKQVMSITLGDMSTPYMNYYTSKWGIPKIVTLNSRSDWEKLFEMVQQLSAIFSESSEIYTYICNAYTTIKNIIVATFDHKSKEFYQGMFSYTKNPQSDAGNNPIIIDGWITNFYLKKKVYIGGYDSHLNCAPYINDAVGKKYNFYATGLSSSRIVDQILFPEFNVIHCEIVHPEAKKIFDILAHNGIKINKQK
jgi:hypothetical protein